VNDSLPLKLVMVYRVPASDFHLKNSSSLSAAHLSLMDHDFQIVAQQNKKIYQMST